jgi:ABC-type multidrug transport system fused ATPase/permease subunit
MLRIQNEMMNLFQSYSSLIKSSGAGDKVFALLDRTPPAPATGSEEDITGSQQTSKSESSSLSLELQNVKFAYPTRPEHPVLRGIDLIVKEGQTLALVGPSGCGKSTIVSLLQRFYDPTGGRILASNIDVKDIGIKAHR